MNKLIVAGNILFFCLFVFLSPLLLASNDLIGQYQCSERNSRDANAPIKSELSISKAKGQYKFVWYYGDGTMYEGLSKPHKNHTSSLTVKFIDMDHANFTEREPGVEHIFIKENGKKLFGKFTTFNHIDDGIEECMTVSHKP